LAVFKCREIGVVDIAERFLSELFGDCQPKTTLGIAAVFARIAIFISAYLASNGVGDVIYRCVRRITAHLTTYHAAIQPDSYFSDVSLVFLAGLLFSD
jgi:hypothetical protein